MGVSLSTHTTTYPLSFASTIIGFVSFAFTLATFFRVTWVNLTTLGEAPHEVHAYLTNLRTELLEEKQSLRSMKKGMRKHRRQLRKENRDSVMGIELDDVSLKTMEDHIKHLIKRFRSLERPFLDKGEHGIADYSNHRRRSRRRNSSSSPPHYSHAAYAPADKDTPEKPNGRARSRDAQQFDDEVEEDAFWAQRTHYAKFTLGRRFIWLTKKSEAQTLYNDLSRVQLRRTARQVGGLAVLMHEYGCGTLELNDTVRRIDERVSRVVGIRRVDRSP